MHSSFDRWWNGISLRTKITGVTVLLLTFGLTVAGVGTMNVLKGYLLGQKDEEIKAGYSELADKYGNGRELVFDGENTFDDEQRSPSLNPYYLAAIDGDGERINDNLPASQASSAPDIRRLDVDDVAQRTGGFTLVAEDRSLEWRIIAYPLKVSDAATGDTSAGVLLVGVSLRNTESIVGNFAIIFFGFALAVVVLGAAMTQLLVTSTFAPLRDVERTAARFAAGDYSQRLGGATPNTEVGRLNRSLNTMLARIDRAFSDRARSVEQMRRFVGDASHELRTPLVSLRGYAELYRMGAIQKPEDVAQAMDRIEREAIRMGALVQDLLELARLDEAREPDLKPVDLLPIAQDAALDASAGNPGRIITVVVPREGLDGGQGVAEADAPEPAQSGNPIDLPLPAGSTTSSLTGVTGTIAGATGRMRFAGNTWARLRNRRRPRALSASAGEALPTAPKSALPDIGPIVLADENKIRQVVTNLMGNAMRFTPDDGPIEIEVDVDRHAGYGAISVVDHGEGIPPQLREKIFQRFWRADTSRTRDTGGSGLGLAIVAGIVANHHGHVEVLETPGGGATFRVSLPLVPAEPVQAESTDAAATTEGTPAAS